MTIVTKYQKGDTLWTMWENKVSLLVVMGIEIYVKETTLISYRFESGKFIFNRSENEVYPTKEELLKSL